VIGGRTLGILVVGKERELAAYEVAELEAAQLASRFVGPLHAPAGPADEDRLVGPAREACQALRNDRVTDRRR
jgi:hypothetical protein